MFQFRSMSFRNRYTVLYNTDAGSDQNATRVTSRQCVEVVGAGALEDGRGVITGGIW